MGVPASASETHEIQVGALNPTNPVSTYSYTRFYPEVMQVHRGDVVRWRWAAAAYFGWHSVTFLPGDMDVAAYPSGLEDAFPPVMRPDEVGVALNELWTFGHAGSPSGASPCGRGPWRNLAAQEICTLSSTDQFLSSSVSDTFFNMPGIPENMTWSTTIDLPPGSYRYHCLVHTSMNGAIQVLADGSQPDKTPEQIEEETSELILADTAAADAVFEALNDPSSAFDPETGTWRVHVGAETPDRGVAIYSFLPTNLEVPPGATVEFVAGMDELNTVTFPPDLNGTAGPPHQGCTPTKCGQGTDTQAGLPGYGLVIVQGLFLCEQDDPRTGLPGVFLHTLRATWACASGNLEWVLPPFMTGPTRALDDEVATRATVHNSGMLMVDSAPAWFGGPYPGGIPRIASSFTARFPNAGEYPYGCFAHADFMKGSVTVA
jgi:plastocyanin